VTPRHSPGFGSSVSIGTTPVAGLVTRARLGDADAFTELVRRYQARCLRFARSMLRTEEDAEEAVQDAWVRVWKALPRYEDQERFEPWLFRILANRCRSRGVRMARDARVTAADDSALAFAEAPDGEVERAAWREEITLALAALPDAQREAFLLHHVEGFAYEEIAGITGVGISALKMRVKRACDHLRERLSETVS
jgi:RNA polymerase sigma-70 factor, ECF subfamily